MQLQAVKGLPRIDPARYSYEAERGSCPQTAVIVDSLSKAPLQVCPRLICPIPRRSLLSNPVLQESGQLQVIAHILGSFIDWLTLRVCLEQGSHSAPEPSRLPGRMQLPGLVDAPMDLCWVPAFAAGNEMPTFAAVAHLSVGALLACCSWVHCSFTAGHAPAHGCHI